MKGGGGGGSVSVCECVCVCVRGREKGERLHIYFTGGGQSFIRRNM